MVEKLRIIRPAAGIPWEYLQMTKEQLTEIIKHVTPTIRDAEILAEYLIANGIVGFAGKEQTNRQWLNEQDDKTFAK